MTELTDLQRTVVQHHGSRAMVLAAPGCGKTHLLAERVAFAHEHHNVAFDDMLCLTFTNRAARGMRERVAGRLGEMPEGLFVGNIHRFCISFLHSNGLISADTAILDEEGADNFINTGCSGGAGWRNQVMALAVDNYMVRHNYPDTMRRKLWFEPTDYMRQRAVEYDAFKRDHGLMDFDDCLLWAFDALREGIGRRYSWIQIDEVQDLTPLQTTIVGMLASGEDATVLYLGDEQQAIFDFLGAGATVLNEIKRLCANRVLHLNRNYRSSAELLELCNILAIEQLGIYPLFLPDVGANPGAGDDSITLWEATSSNQYTAAASLAYKLYKEHPDETVAILVRTNFELDRIHRLLDACGIDHLAVGAYDLFRQMPFRTLYAHFVVALNPRRTTEWARILYQTGCVRRLEDAEKLVADMREAAMTPADLLSADGLTYIERKLLKNACGEAFSCAELAEITHLLFPERRGNAIDDVFEMFGVAGDEGRALTAYLVPIMKARLAMQQNLDEMLHFDALRVRINTRYAPLYAHTQRLLVDTDPSAENTLAAELDYVYRELVLKGYIRPIPRWKQVVELLSTVVADHEAEPTLSAQLGAHLNELCSFNEGDLCDKGLAGRLAVMTVHKAKGLEMDNVVVANASTFRDDGLDRARIFYVAFSRARKRLAVFYTKYLNSSLECVEDMFLHMGLSHTKHLADRLKLGK